MHLLKIVMSSSPGYLSYNNKSETFLENNNAWWYSFAENFYISMSLLVFIKLLCFNGQPASLVKKTSQSFK